MAIRQLIGDCRVTLATLPAASVQTCVTSPPYYSLRDYGTEPLVWGGDMEHEHEWGIEVTRFVPARQDHAGAYTFATSRGVESARVEYTLRHGQACGCGAWLGSLGLEPTPELYIEHIVECFRPVRRVLRDDGTVWLNLGDSYAGSGKGESRSLNKGNPHSHEAALVTGRVKYPDLADGLHDGYHGEVDYRTRPRWPTYAKPKDLMMMPARVALALQADGWWLRSMIPWVKRSAMPESVTDRPATAVEYVFLLSKSARYYWDADAVRVASDPDRKLFTPGTKQEIVSDTSGRVVRNDGLARLGQRMNDGLATGRNRRNSDWFLESWQGLMLDEHDNPMALVVNPQPFSGAHFATFPARLVEPMIKASTSEKGQCPECGAPWVRVTETERQVLRMRAGEPKNVDNGTPVQGGYRGTTTNTTTGWRASCAHAEASPVPQTVLDIFSGAGTVGLVADRLGRNAVLCELKPGYAEMGTDRITGDAPLFTDVEVSPVP